MTLIHIDRLCDELQVTRDWLTRNWLRSDCPPPHFRDGDQVFFETTELEAWARRRALGSDYTDTEGDPSA